MFNTNTVPSINIYTGSYGLAEIIKENDRLFNLFDDGVEIDSFNINTNTSLKQQYSAYDLAQGNVLISRLGLGVITLWIASKPSVNHVTVIEKSKDVIDLFLINNDCPDNVTILHEDPANFRSMKHFDYIYFDSNNEMHDTNDFYFFLNRVHSYDSCWAYGIERFYAEYNYDVPGHLDRCVTKSDFKLCCCTTSHRALSINRTLIDFYDGWDFFVSKHFKKIKLPTISRKKINEYVQTYYNRLGYELVINTN
jgi:hypothetical protein